ncbi:hypothetical protein MRX96_014802 [Rhipicephalus microplus]
MVFEPMVFEPMVFEPMVFEPMVFEPMVFEPMVFEPMICEVVATPGPWTAEPRITDEETKRCTVGHPSRTTETAIVAVGFFSGKNLTGDPIIN